MCVKIRFILSILSVLLFVLPVISSGAPGEVLKFEPGDTLEEIREKIEHNGYSFTVDHNWVYDMDPEMKQHFFRRHMPPFPAEAAISEDRGPLTKNLGKQLPIKFDWRDYGGHSYIGPVRDQGSCGSCYSFAACAAAEGAYNWASDNYDANCADFSESFIIWCLGKYGPYDNHFSGCDGADYGYYELEALTGVGIIRENKFPYTTDDPGSCAHWSDPATTYRSWHRVTCSDIDAIKTAIMTYGVVDAAVYVEGAFQAYGSGVYDDTNTTCEVIPCYYATTNHAVALVGWDDNPPEGGGGCWILRNSWGPAWGESGYMRIRYNAARVACAIAYLVYAIEPSATTGTAINVSFNTATLQGVTNPNNASTTYYFEYGTTFGYGSSTAVSSAGSGSGDVSVSAPLSGLTANTTYYYRLVTVNKFGTTYGNELTFTTSPPAITTGSASSVTPSSAIMNGNVNPNGSSTTYFFQYGTTTAYGSNTISTNAGSGAGDVAASTEIEGLTGRTLYHFRIAAVNSVGTSYGEDATFTTAAYPPGGSDGGPCFITTVEGASITAE
jgi:C1A family cysteine protease